MKRVLESFKNVLSLLLQDFINFIHYFDGFGKTEGKERDYVRELRKTGIVIIPDFISAESCDEIRTQILGLTERYPNTIKLDNGTYFDYRNETNKTGADHGMIDIYNVDRTIDRVRSIDTSFMFRVLKATVGDQKLFLPRINAYVNRGITGTRVYHIDNAQPVVYKAFIYLSDVTDESYGPYAIVKGTQRFSPSVYWNLVRNVFRKNCRIPDMFVFRKRNVVHVKGKKGTLILSNQNAIHRGLPQAPDKERIALVYSFFVVSRLSYLHSSFREILKEADEAPNRKM